MTVYVPGKCSVEDLMSVGLFGGVCRFVWNVLNFENLSGGGKFNVMFDLGIGITKKTIYWV